MTILAAGLYPAIYAAMQPVNVALRNSYRVTAVNVTT